MLRKSEVNFIQARKDESKAMTPPEKQKMYRVRKKALKTIKDMTYLAENLPEKQIGQIFNSDSLIPFFIAIFHKADADKKRIRKIILPLIGYVLGDEEFVLRIIPEKAREQVRGRNPMELVEGLFFTSMYSE